MGGIQFNFYTQKFESEFPVDAQLVQDAWHYSPEEYLCKNNVE